MKILFRFVLILLFTSIIGCSGYTPPKTYNVVNETTISKSFDVVWEKTIEWFATHNTPIKIMDKNSGLITTDYNLTVEMAGNYMDCGEGGSAYYVFASSNQKLENPMGNFNVLIKKVDENNTKATINVFFSCLLNTYTSTTYGTSPSSSEKINCNSKGVLERQIIEYLNK